MYKTKKVGKHYKYVQCNINDICLVTKKATSQLNPPAALLRQVSVTADVGETEGDCFKVNRHHFLPVSFHSDFL